MNLTDDSDRVVTRSLQRLADHAPTHLAYDPHPRRRRRPAAALAVVAIAAASAILGAVVAPQVLEPAPSTHSADATASPSSEESTLILGDVSSWPRVRLSTCDEWSPAGGNEVVEVDAITDECISKAPLDAVVVLRGGYTADGPFGSRWADTTEVWREVGSHSVRRLVSGPLVEMSSRAVDGLVCDTCDEVLVVIGPEPASVSRLVESITAG
ncbi:hypothetical protein [Nocardioides zeae]|uniref:Uncharacterized protein n=1 Tax=Nocardioides zeae TaxID=1457234 RepID=A0AAJ1U8P2_9ACTN|nr:hypothetical protein [Nocardioides zeae]MDQ1106421.1 hypothetical protein [Nocardioides zeae]